MMSRNPYSFARWKGVRPSLSFAIGSAPAPTRSLQVSSDFIITEQCKGPVPSKSAWFTSQPWSTNILTMFACFPESKKYKQELNYFILTEIWDTDLTQRNIGACNYHRSMNLCQLPLKAGQTKFHWSPYYTIVGFDNTVDYWRFYLSGCIMQWSPMKACRGDLVQGGAGLHQVRNWG